jgi:uncharacterized repeat protein (TIGR03803 family)
MKAAHLVTTLLACTLVVFSVIGNAAAQTYTVLHSFQCGASPSDGSSPVAGLIPDTEGNLYGTTSAGGESGQGTVFKIGSDASFIVLHSFAGGLTDGSTPVTPMLSAIPSGTCKEQPPWVEHTGVAGSASWVLMAHKLYSGASIRT